MPDGTTRDILPIGSVVRLDGSDALVMVMGYEPDLGEVQADYLGVPWPMGLVTDDAALAFDAPLVAEIVSRGLWDDEAEAGLAAVRRYRAATRHAHQSMRELLDSLTHERFLELRDKYAIDAVDEEPEPDFPELDDFLEDEGEPDMLGDEPEPDFLDGEDLA